MQYLSLIPAMALGYLASRIFAHPTSRIRRKLPNIKTRRVQVFPVIRIRVFGRIVHLHHWIYFSIILVVSFFVSMGIVDYIVTKGVFLGGIIHGLTLSKKHRKIIHKNCSLEKLIFIDRNYKAENPSNLLMVLTGKTASGKDTIMAKLLSGFLGFKRIVTTTSRKQRPGEKNGVDYNFISEQNFKLKIDRGDFIEYVEYGGNLYGTEKAQIIKNLDYGLIWRIDPSRAGRIREFIKSAFDQHQATDLLRRLLVIYLTTPDAVVLERLKKRGLTPAEIEKRMQEDAKFWQEFKNNYDFVIENIPGKLDETISQISELIEIHKKRN